MSDSSDLLKPFFYEQSINGKVYRIYTVNSIGLLNLTSNEALCDVIKIIDIVKKGDIDTLILLLSDNNWRTQIIGVVGSFAVGVKDKIISKMWNLFDQSSWISLQIAASLFLQDKDFIEKAVVRVNNLCDIENETVREQWKLSSIETISRSKKGLTSLLVLCRQVPSLEDWADKKLMSPEFKKITISPNIEQVSNLCLNWMKHMSMVKTG